MKTKSDCLGALLLHQPRRRCLAKEPRTSSHHEVLTNNTASIVDEYGSEKLG